MDLAHLEVRIDSAPIQQTTDHLHKLTPAAKSAGQAVDGFGEASARTAQRLGSYASQAEAAVGKLTRGEREMLDAMEQRFAGNIRLSNSEARVVAALQEQIQFLSMTKEEQAAYNAIRIAGSKADSAAAVVIETLAKSYVRLKDVQKAAAAQAAETAQQEFNSFLMPSGSGKSARGSAEVFEEASKKSRTLKADIAALAQAASLAGGPVGSLFSRFGFFGLGIGRMGIAVIGFTAVLSAMTLAALTSVAAFQKLEDQQNRIKNQLEFTRGSSGQGNASIEAAVQSASRFGQNTSEAVRNAASELLKFRGVSGQVFTEALDLANRFSATGLLGVVEAARLMGTAFRNPAEGVQALRDAGFSLSPVLERNIKNLYDAGRVVEAQRALYRALADQLGGVQGGQGLSGAYTGLGNSITRLLGEMGKEFAAWSRLEGVLRTVAGLIDRVTDAKSKSAGFSWQAMFAGIPFLNAPITAVNSGKAVFDYLNPKQTFANRGKQQQETDLAPFERIDGLITRSGAVRDEQKQRIDKVTDALKEELRVLQMSSVQQRIDASLRQAGIDVKSKEGQAIAQLIAAQEAVNLTRSTRENIMRRQDDARIEIATVNMTTVAAERYRLVQEALSEARIKGINLSPAQIALLEKEAEAYARLRTAANAARLEREITFERQQFGRTESEQRIATTLRQYGIEANSAQGQYLANQLRINESLRTTRDLAGDALKGFAQDLLRGVSAAEAFSNVLNRVASKLMDMAIDNLVAKAFGGVGGAGGLSGIFSFLSGGSSSSFTNYGMGPAGAIENPMAWQFHEGGIAGYGGKRRRVHPSVFSGAARYHEGGIAGIRPDEIPAILRRGEIVFKDWNQARETVGTMGQSEADRSVNIQFGDIRVPDDSEGSDPSGLRRARSIGQTVKAEVQRQLTDMLGMRGALAR